MANADKNILITPNIDQASLPSIEFTGFDTTTMTLAVRDNSELVFTNASNAEVFSIDPSTSGVVFNVGNTGALPLVEVNATTDEVKLTPTVGVTKIGTAYTNLPYDQLSVSLEVAGKASGGSPPVALTDPSNGSMIIATRGTGIHLSIGIEANTTPQYSWMQCRHSTNGSAYDLNLQPLGGAFSVGDKPIANRSLSTSTSSSAVGQNVTIHYPGTSFISFGSYPGTWTPALQIQSTSNDRYLWLSPIQSATQARLRTGGQGFDMYVGGSGTSSTTGTELINCYAGETRTDSAYYNGSFYEGPSYGGSVRIHGSLTLKTYNAPTGYPRKLSLFQYRNTVGGTYYVHMKTNIPYYNTYAMVLFEAKGYTYGNGGRVSCSWNWYTYTTGTGPYNIQYWTDNDTSSTKGMAASTMYQSSDGYCVIVGYTNGHYYMGFVLDAYLPCPNTGGHDPRITAATYSSSQTGAF